MIEIGDGCWGFRERRAVGNSGGPSLYVKDDPAGDSVYMLDASISWDDTTCGPRGTLELFPLLEGDIEIHR